MAVERNYRNQAGHDADVCRRRHIWLAARCCRPAHAWWCSGGPSRKDGYEAAQLGLVEFVKPQRVNKAMTGHFKKANVAADEGAAGSCASKNRKTKPKLATACWWKVSRPASWWTSAASARAKVLPAA